MGTSPLRPLALFVGAAFLLVAGALPAQAQQSPLAEIKDASDATVFQVNYDAALLGLGSLNTGTIPATGAGTRMMWYPGKAAFRAGGVDGTQWDDGNIGSNSVAFGRSTVARGDRSVALGDDTQATGNNAVATGGRTLASGSVSTAMGLDTEASGLVSTAMGRGTTASANHATAMGFTTTASGVNSTAMGALSFATGDNATAIGLGAVARAYGSLAIGRYNLVGGSQTTWEPTDQLFVVGNGDSNTNRSNALALRKNGDLIVGNNVTAQGGVAATNNVVALQGDVVANTGNVRAANNVRAGNDANIVRDANVGRNLIVSNNVRVQNGIGIGLGTSALVTRFQVKNNVSGSGGAGSPENFVAVFENTASDNGDVLYLKTGDSTPNANENFITFVGGSNSVGAIQGTGSGIEMISGGADFAEMLPRLDVSEFIDAGKIVGVTGGKITQRTAGAERLMVVSDQAIIVGNAPMNETEKARFEKVAFIGQVPTWVEGRVAVGDWIVASGRGDGIGRAVAPEDWDPATDGPIVGQAWEAQAGGTGRVNTAIGLDHTKPLIDRLTRQQAEIEVLQQRLEQLDAIEARLQQLEARAGN